MICSQRTLYRLTNRSIKWLLQVPKCNIHSHVTTGTGIILRESTHQALKASPVMLMVRPMLGSKAMTVVSCRALQSPRNPLSLYRSIALRPLSSGASGGEKVTNDKQQTSSSEGGGGGDAAGEETKEIVLTPGEKVVAVTRLTMWAGIAVFACACAYYIGAELIPTKMSPNSVFDRSLDQVRAHPDVVRRFGEPLKGYGRDHGGHREGRRNFIEHTQYTSEDDGTKRTRVRYNLEGRYGTAFVFAEQSASMPSGEFVYVLVQDKSNGRVFTVVDNRAALTAARLSGSKETSSAISQLLTGSSNQK